jgi:hypothetical protein
MQPPASASSHLGAMLVERSCLGNGQDDMLRRKRDMLPKIEADLSGFGVSA